MEERENNPICHLQKPLFGLFSDCETLDDVDSDEDVSVTCSGTSSSLFVMCRGEKVVGRFIWLVLEECSLSAMPSSLKRNRGDDEAERTVLAVLVGGTVKATTVEETRERMAHVIIDKDDFIVTILYWRAAELQLQ